MDKFEAVVIESYQTLLSEIVGKPHQILVGFNSSKLVTINCIKVDYIPIIRCLQVAIGLVEEDPELISKAQTQALNPIISLKLCNVLREGSSHKLPAFKNRARLGSHILKDVFIE